MRRAIWCFFLLFFSACGSSESPRADLGVSDHRVSEVSVPDQGTRDQSVPLSPKELIDELVQPIMEGQWALGVIIGLHGPDGEEYLSYGSLSPMSEEIPRRDTLFEIGSVSKTFTSLALARMVEADMVALDQPVQALLLQGEVTVPERNGSPITLLHLSTHTSGLPSQPDNLAAPDYSTADPPNPMRDYEKLALYEFLSGYTLPRDPGAEFEYSNLGVGLLGHALARRANKTYGEMIAAQITGPLGMADTGLVLDGAQQARFAQGYDSDLNPRTPWDFKVLVGAGGLRSTAQDILIYLKAQLGMGPAPMSGAIAATHQEHLDDPQMGLAWFISDERYIYHNGGTAGFASYAGFDPQTQHAVVVLANVGNGYKAIPQLGEAVLKLLAGTRYEPVELPATVAVPETTLQKYVGKYLFAQAGLEIEVTLEAGQLYVLFPDLPNYRLYAESEEVFYIRAAKLTFQFKTDGTGAYNQLLFTNDESTITFTRSDAG